MTMKFNSRKRFRAVPFCDVYGKNEWCDPAIFGGYLAVIPLCGSLADPRIRTVRRQNLVHVLECEIARHPSLVRVLRGPKHLPSEMRVRYRVIVTRGWKDFEHNVVNRRTDRVESRIRWVSLDDCIRHGLSQAISRAATLWLDD